MSAVTANVGVDQPVLTVSTINKNYTACDNYLMLFISARIIVIITSYFSRSQTAMKDNKYIYIYIYRLQNQCWHAGQNKV